MDRAKETLEIRANCKINIGLNIVRKREDGYHEVETLCYPVKGLYDVITLELLEGDGVEFVSKGMVVDCADEDNLCLKAYAIMARSYQFGGVRITLDKRVPFGAGLGGGSADATQVLVGLNSLFELNISDEELIDMAAMLGSDTALFVRNTPQMCQGRGEVLSPSALDLSGLWIVMVKPPIHISTKQAFSGVTPSRWSTPLAELIALPIEQWQGVVSNDFETSIFAYAPILSDIKQSLLDTGAIYASMSGSGSTVYALYPSLQAAQSALHIELINTHLVTLPFELAL